MKNIFSNFRSHIKDSKWGRKCNFINCISSNRSPQEIPFQFANGKVPHSRCIGFWAFTAISFDLIVLRYLRFSILTFILKSIYILCRDTCSQANATRLLTDVRLTAQSNLGIVSSQVDRVWEYQHSLGPFINDVTPEGEGRG